MERSYGFPSNYFQNTICIKNLCMQKTPEFDASYAPLVTDSKGMLKTPEFDATYDPIVTISKGMKKNLQNLTHHMTL